MIDDLIRRQAALNALQEEINKGIPPYDDIIGAIRNGVRLARDIIEDLPTAPYAEHYEAGYAAGYAFGTTVEKRAREWNPCSEVNPIFDGEYLVTFADEDGEWIGTAEWNTTFGGRWQVDCFDACYSDVNNVIAWMLPPAPYKAEGRADE